MRLSSSRLLDLSLGSVGLFLSLPGGLAVALAIRFLDGGPVLFRQQRIGQLGRPFDLLKFRTMRATGGALATETAPASRLGTFLRRFHIDELPQLINVLRGEMSLVGPRPERPELVQLFAAQLPDYPRRHQLRPGITGWAQVNTGDGVSLEETRVKLTFDLEYLQNRSLGLDLAILLRTVQVVLFGFRSPRVQ